MGTWHDDRVTAGRGTLSHLNDPRRQLVIVALPDEDDPVRKYSSEKEPHLTLLYLGTPDYDDDQIAHIEGYVQHAASLIHNFGLEVESRGELGDKKADVLFLRKRWSREIVTFREQLLQDPLISAAYHSADQFPEWVPHLTMGFPDSPAKKDGSETPRFYSVNFDRIALWTGDSKGPTVFLKPYEYDPEVAMSQISQGRSVVEDLIAHQGVKGMKWGVRKDRGHEGEEVKTKKIEKLDKNFERKSQSFRTSLAIHNRASELSNKNDIDRINNKPQYKDVDFSRDTPLRRKYYDEHQKAFVNNLEKAASELGTNASGTKKYSILEHEDGSWDVTVVDAKRVRHADTPDEDSFRVKVKYDSTRHILKIVMPEEEFIEQGDVFMKDFLEHFGIKGMKWGVRRADTSASATPSSNDARVADEASAKIKSSGVKSLSNQELKVLVERMNLEQRYSTMVNDKTKDSRINRGHDNVKKALKVAKTAEQIHKFAKSDLGKLIRQTVEAGISDVARKAAA